MSTKAEFGRLPAIKPVLKSAIIPSHQANRDIVKTKGCMQVHASVRCLTFMADDHVLTFQIDAKHSDLSPVK